MAKVTSIVNITGSLGDLVFYRVDGRTRIRRKCKDRSQHMKQLPSYAHARKRTDHLKLANSFATAIYRMAKEYATKVNYKVHNLLSSRLYHVVKNEAPLDLLLLSNTLKGVYLNYNDTLPIVNVSRYDNQLLINYDHELEVPAEVTICIGQLPEIEEKQGVRSAATDMQHVDLLSFSVLGGTDLGHEFIPMDFKPGQVIMVIVKYETKERFYEWVRIV